MYTEHIIHSKYTVSKLLSMLMQIDNILMQTQYTLCRWVFG